MLAHCSSVLALPPAPSMLQKRWAVHACLAALFAVFLVNRLLVNTPVLLLCAEAAPLPSWVDLEILPVA